MRSNTYQNRLLILAATAAGALVAPTLVQAAGDEHVFVMPDGRRIALTESKSELGVMFRSQVVPADVDNLLRSQSFVRSTSNKWVDANAPGRVVTVTGAPKARAAELLAVPGVTSVDRVFRFATSDAPAIATGTLLARVVHDLPESERASLWERFGIVSAVPMAGLRDSYLLTAEQGTDEVALAASLAGDPRTVWSQPNFRLSKATMQVVPQDEFFDFQWHLDNQAQVAGFEDAVLGADIGVLEAWEIATGTGVLIGMFDDACDVDHEDLAVGYIGVGQSPEEPVGSPFAEDPRPFFFGEDHGTRVMGLAVARANEVGGRGVAYGSTFTASRGLFFATAAQDASVYVFAMEQEVDVHINSWGYIGIPVPAIVADAIDTAFREGRNLGDLNGDGVDDPLGMVILFSSGNADRDLVPPFEGTENVDGFEISTLDSVISVGASTDQDRRASYSSYGESLDVLAPSWDVNRAGLFTTDNTDAAYPAGVQGANVGGSNTQGFPAEADPTGSYTQYFNGTSGACPIAAGVAALVLSANPELSATDVRLIMEHTADKIDPVRADYDSATSHSLRYGYGRVDAAAAVAAASAARSNGGFTWPDRVADVSVEQIDREIHFTQASGTNEFLILQSDDDIEFVPEDGICYHPDQNGCGAPAVIADLPAGVEVFDVGCSIACSGPGATCAAGSEHCFSYDANAGTQHFAIIARNGIGRYAWVVTAASNGEIRRSGGDVGTVTGSGGDAGDSSAVSVSISASPTQGESPLTVRFRGNAVSESAIDDSRTIWTFNTQDEDGPTATTRNTTHIYTAPVGETRVYLARLTMFDVNGNSGSRSVSISVDGGIVEDGSDTDIQELSIRISTPGNPTSDIREGTAPLDVLLAVDASGLPGTLQSVSWDLGDGTRATTLSVPHTYRNETGAVITYPISVNVTMLTESGSATFAAPTVFLRVASGADTPDPQEPSLPGTNPIDGGITAGCGAMGMLTALGMLLPLGLARRSRRRRGAR